jgi:ABC-2 type transport system ATP-binding protein
MSGSPPPLRFDAVSKRFGEVVAVEGVTFTVEPNRVVGLLGPNGAGKTTLLGIAAGLVRPTWGRVEVFGADPAARPEVMLRVGVAPSELRAMPHVTGRRHLQIAAAARALPGSRVGEVLALVGLAGAAGQRVGQYSLGMRQRLSLASALLAEPDLLILDEPGNGLDPEGTRWLRGFIRELAAAGTGVLLSSHALADVERTVDDVVVLRTRPTFVGPLGELLASASTGVLVRSGDDARLAALLEGAGGAVAPRADGGLKVTGLSVSTVAGIAAAAEVDLGRISQESEGLEDVFFDLVGAGAGGVVAASAPAAGRSDDYDRRIVAQ